MWIAILRADDLVRLEEPAIRRRDDRLRLEEARKALPGEEDKHRAAA